MTTPQQTPEEMPGGNGVTMHVLVAKQALEIAQLRLAIKDAVSELRDASIQIVGIGGPLNDDRLGCSKEQRTLFWRIYNGIEGALSILDSVEPQP